MLDFELAVFAREDVFSFSINKANNGEVPRRLAVFFEQFGFGARFVVANEEGDKVAFDGLDEERVAEDFGPEVFAGASSRDFLKEKEDGFAGLG